MSALSEERVKALAEEGAIAIVRHGVTMGHLRDLILRAAEEAATAEREAWSEVAVAMLAWDDCRNPGCLVSDYENCPECFERLIAAAGAVRRLRARAPVKP